MIFAYRIMYNLADIKQPTNYLKLNELKFSNKSNPTIDRSACLLNKLLRYSNLVSFLAYVFEFSAID